MNAKTKTTKKKAARKTSATQARAARPSDGMSIDEMTNAPSAGTAGNPAGYEASVWAEQSGPVQRDDGEATDPEAVLSRQVAELQAKVQRLSSGAGSAANGFKWATDTYGKPILKPTNEPIKALAATVTTWLENSDERDALLHRDSELHGALAEFIERVDKEQKYAPLRDMARYVADLGDQAPDMSRVNKQLTRAVRRIDAVNQYMATNFIKSIAKQAGQDCAGALYWLEIHGQKVVEHRRALRDDAAERSLLMYESSRTQALISAQIIDWAAENEVIISPAEMAESYLKLRGWQLANQNTANDRAKQREYDTREAMFGHSIS